jgi:hypothetical protein
MLLAATVGAAVESLLVATHKESLLMIIGNTQRIHFGPTALSGR